MPLNRQGLSEEQKNELLAEAEKKRYERRRQERERFEATADRLSGGLRSLSSGVEKTAYREAKGIEPLPGVPVRNRDLLVPGYDVEGKLWTIQYIKEDGTKRFAKDSRKHGCFHVVGAANAAEGLQKLANPPVMNVSIHTQYDKTQRGSRYQNQPSERIRSIAKSCSSVPGLFNIRVCNSARVLCRIRAIPWEYLK